MIHGPCDALNPQASCMENGMCSNKYPKPFVSQTTMNKDGYPYYRRSDDGKTIAINPKKIVDNRFIVPYNPVLFNVRLSY